MSKTHRRAHTTARAYRIRKQDHENEKTVRRMRKSGFLDSAIAKGKP